MKMTLPNGYRFPDVSHYRTVCDWSAYDNYPVSACKCTEGSSGKDSSFNSWRSNMRARGLFPVPYHFLRRDSSVLEQVNNYLRAADDGKPFGIMLDLETAGNGSNATISQANEWFNRVRDRTGVPRSRMLLYMPRWWYNAHGGGSTILKDTILYQSAYSTSPSMAGFAGDMFEVLQYSSTAPIAGLCSPGNGDMNIAINMTAQQFKGKLTGTGSNGGVDELQLRTLRKGNVGGDVKSLQLLLEGKAGQRVNHDGRFTDGVETGVKNVQRFFGLTPDGVVGPKTWGVLFL